MKTLSKSIIFAALPFLLFCSAVMSSTDSTEKVYENPSGAPALALIQSAKKSVDIEIYTMQDAKIHAALIDAISRGVRLRIIQEPSPTDSHCAIFGDAASSDDAECVASRNFIAQVRSLGGTYVPFNKNLCGTQTIEDDQAMPCLEHGKMLIVDGATALISTGNLDSTNLCDTDAGAGTCNRDYTYTTDDSAILGALQSIYEKDLLGNPYDVGTFLTGAVANKLTVSPLSLQPLLNFIDSAQKTLQIDNQYLKQNDINQAIIRAARRGVNVEITVASACSFSPPNHQEAAQFSKIYSAFEAAGISARMFTRNNLINGMPGYMHAKVIVVDGKRAWVGSVNGSNMAVLKNREFGIFTDTPELVQTLSSDLKRDHDDPSSESWQDSIACREKLH